MSNLESAIRILHCLSADTPTLKVTDVASRLGLAKSSVSRLLRTMHEGGLLKRDENAPIYGPGPLALELSRLYAASNSLLDKVDAALASLVEEFGFTGFAGMLDGDEVVILRQHQGWYRLRYVLEVGEHHPPSDMAIGVALMARHNLLGSPEIGPAQRKQAKAFMADRVIEVPCRSVPGITAIGTALREDRNGQCIGFSISFPDNAAPAAMRGKIKSRIQTASRAIAQEIGDSFHLPRNPKR
ncbi:helix-turn-helix domain-containing protein [Ferrovibrio sp.]|uniref:IclR family transcriptional regulator n=1 Tax=Ferrovibrio sp. TaxID=1917215 RepID=UPI0025C3D615|nr:helix-turn-helix domain-containing protein [Ferrovibrio sp.]MBX3453356.1 helix-turn-helix domain-containing protein [Ferrovibrio sp.]